MIPKDPVMLLSYINTQLRDHFENLEELCKSLSIDDKMLIEKMESISYEYDNNTNQFR
ncbi:MAG: DUF4250 domain-containing protein [Hespellia sp.]|nr:DUF4250 domain-containing protein [Hespellia sp.]